MNLQRIISQPQKQAKAYLAERVEAWKKFDNDHKSLIDEAREVDQVKISGQDGSVLYGKERNMGHHGTFFTELIEKSDGSANLYSVSSDMSWGWNVQRNVDGSYEGVDFELKSEERPPQIQTPPSVLAIFSDYAPVTEAEPTVQANSLEASKAEELFTSTKSGMDDWDLFLADDPLDYRQEFFEFRK